MKCVILQPSYIPWRGYFDQIYKADLFVFYDDVQYDRHGWRNRNQIKSPDGAKWLTIPVLSKGTLTNKLLINQVDIAWNKDWTKAHLGTIKQFYGKAPYFSDYHLLLEEHYSRRTERLADLTIDLTIAIARELGIHHTKF